MNWQRFVFMALVEVMKELTSRLGHHDLAERCEECKGEIEAAPDDSKKEG